MQKIILSKEIKLITTGSDKMISTFIIILFLLNFITIFAVILLYMRQNRLIELEKQQHKNNEKSAELLSSFLYEIKEENERFMEKIATKDITEQDVTNVVNTEQEKTTTFDHVEDDASTENVLADLFVYDQIEAQEEPFVQQVKKLQNQGLSIEQIAKKLNKGKTEIDLLLKFQK